MIFPCDRLEKSTLRRDSTFGKVSLAKLSVCTVFVLEVERAIWVGRDCEHFDRCLLGVILLVAGLACPGESVKAWDGSCNSCWLIGTLLGPVSLRFSRVSWESSLLSSSLSLSLMHGRRRHVLDFVVDAV